MKSIINVGTAAIVAAVLATPAAAQMAGTYTGTSADGQGLTFTVATDTNTGNLAVTGATIFFSAPCRVPEGDEPYTLDTGWGFGLMNDISDRKVTISATDNYFTFEVSLTFARSGETAIGRITSISPTLYPVGATPTRALLCRSPAQSLTLNTFTPPGAEARKALPNIKGKVE